MTLHIYLRLFEWAYPVAMPKFNNGRRYVEEVFCILVGVSALAAEVFRVQIAIPTNGMTHTLRRPSSPATFTVLIPVSNRHAGWEECNNRHAGRRDSLRNQLIWKLPRRARAAYTKYAGTSDCIRVCG